ncbi:uncharacterized protein LOC141704170 [Apium graveolens]|uniref:uncharacterized protein LOC141704170 n=1 Tax=Apium graveolens TaxID=4045 RepID=UPI003D7A9386
MADMKNNLASVDSTRTDWRVRVRITRMWPSFSHIQQFRGVNLILLDSEDCHVFAFVNRVTWHDVSNIILEGNTFDIHNFIVMEPAGLLRPVSSDKIIIFAHDTIVHPVPFEVKTIPRHKFERKTIPEISELAISLSEHVHPVYAINIGGMAQNIEPVKEVYTRFGEKKFLRFELFDDSNVVKICVWDQVTDDVANALEGNVVYPPIVILTTMRPLIHNGSLQIRNSSCSQIYFNINHPAVEVLRQRILGGAV